MAVTVTKAPTQTVTNLSWSRTGNKYTLSWKVPSNLTSESNPARATSFLVQFQLKASYVTNYDLVVNNVQVSTSTTSYSWTVPNKWLGKYNLYQLRGKVASYNTTTSKGVKYLNQKWTDETKTAITINAPYAPTLSTPTWDSEAGTVKCTLTGKSASRDYPRYQYYYEIWRASVLGGVTTKGKLVESGNRLGWDTNSTLTSTLSRTEEAKIQYDTDYITYLFAATPVGLRGKGSTTYKRIYISKPAKPSISSITRSTTGKGVNVVIYYDQQTKKHSDANANMHPTESHQMYIAYANKKGQISSWSPIGDENSVPSCGFFLNDDDITPEVGQHVYLKCVAIRQGFNTESDIVDIDDMLAKNKNNKFSYYEKPSNLEPAPISTVAITATSAGTDNASVIATIGYPDSTVYDACEISYSSDADAWESTKQPDTYQMLDTAWQDAKSQSEAHAYTSTIKIADLDEGTKYYMRARRYNSANENQHSKWSQLAEQSTNQDELTGLVLTGSDIVATGKSASFSWEFPDGLKQSNWYIYKVTTNSEKQNVYEALETGTGSITMVSHTFDEAGTYRICAKCEFEDGRDMTSSEIQVQVIDAPSVKYTVAPTSPLTALPQTFTVQAVDKDGNKQEDADLQIKVLAYGILSQKPDGNEQQYTNDVVASFDGTGEVTCEISEGSVLWNNGSYQIQAVASANGVKSDTYTCDFNVAYSASVTAPSEDDVIITPTDTKGATIQVNNLEDGQTWDLYRATKDERNFLIKSGLSSGVTVEDKFAPYCSKTNSQYIVLVKNTNAQTDYRYYDYVADYDVLRFDWDNKFVELPYNIEIEDETDKQFEQQIYLDGTQKGAWGASVIRQASLSTDTIYITDEDTQRKVRDLARYQGAVFVRTPLGQAYTANVEVNKISKSYDSKVMAVSFDCTEIDLTSDFEATSTEA
jgi:hypothetical protein